jgi:hypothetical protein
VVPSEGFGTIQRYSHFPLKTASWHPDMSPAGSTLLFALLRLPRWSRADVQQQGLSGSKHCPTLHPWLPNVRLPWAGFRTTTTPAI